MTGSETSTNPSDKSRRRKPGAGAASVAQPPGIYETTAHLGAVLVLLVVFLAVGFFVLVPAPEQLSHAQLLTLETLKEHREKWQASRPASFRYTVAHSCFCTEVNLEPYIASEQRGYRTAWFTAPIRSYAGEVIVSPPRPVWIDDLFGLIEEFASSGETTNIEYDTEYGFPASVDMRSQYPDSGEKYEIRDFEKLE